MNVTVNNNVPIGDFIKSLTSAIENMRTNVLGARKIDDARRAAYGDVIRFLADITVME